MSSALLQLLRFISEIEGGAALPASSMRPKRSAPANPSAISVCMSASFFCTSRLAASGRPNCLRDVPPLGPTDRVILATDQMIWRQKNSIGKPGQLLQQEVIARVSIRNHNMIWRQTRLMALIHCRVGCFDMFGEKFGVEQWRRYTIVRQFVLDSR
jgi:hypothetical protein